MVTGTDTSTDNTDNTANTSVVKPKNTTNMINEWYQISFKCNIII